MKKWLYFKHKWLSFTALRDTYKPFYIQFYVHKNQQKNLNCWLFLYFSIDLYLLSIYGIYGFLWYIYYFYGIYDYDMIFVGI